MQELHYSRFYSFCTESIYIIVGRGMGSESSARELELYRIERNGVAWQVYVHGVRGDESCGISP